MRSTVYQLICIWDDVFLSVMHRAHREKKEHTTVQTVLNKKQIRFCQFICFYFLSSNLETSRQNLDALTGSSKAMTSDKRRSDSPLKAQLGALPLPLHTTLPTVSQLNKMSLRRSRLSCSLSKCSRLKRQGKSWKGSGRCYI